MDFSEKVFTVCRSIPWGKVVSYGQIALLCGSPRQARRVGYVLGHVQPKKGEDIPAHRVINSSFWNRRESASAKTNGLI